MPEDRQFELVEVARKKRTGSSGRTARKPAEQAGNPDAGQRHRYANVDDPHGLRRRRANGAVSDGDFLRAARESSGKEIRLHHEEGPGSAGSTEEPKSGTARREPAERSAEPHRSHASGRGRRYHDYGTVSLGSLPQAEPDSAQKASDHPAAGAEHSSGGDVYTRMMNRKYKGKNKRLIRILIVIAVLVAALVLAFFFSRRTVGDTLLPKPDVESLPEETFQEAETIQSNE